MRQAPFQRQARSVNKKLIDPWFYASGYPISDAYWSQVKINGILTDVMIQAFERRVLTYVPTNVPGFEVEMGNIGLHYYDWRYKDAGKPSETPTVNATSTPPGTSTPGTPGTPSSSGSPTTTPPGGGTATTTPPATVTGTPPTATATATPTVNVVTDGVIVFTSSRSGNLDIWRMRGDGTQAIQLTNNPADEDWPSLSPDNAKIAFSSTRDGNSEIYVMNVDGSGVTRLTDDPGADYQPTWSPDGSKIAFVSTRGSISADIFVMTSNGTGVTNITQAAGNDTDPSWGASGTIAFTSNRSGTPQVYTVNPDGSGLFGPLTTSGKNYYPKWNSVGNRIAFVSDRDGNPRDLHDEAGWRRAVQTYKRPGQDYWPAYSPDSSRIVFTSNRIDPANHYELYTMNIDGTNQQRITIQTGVDRPRRLGHTDYSLVTIWLEARGTTLVGKGRGTERRVPFFAI